MKLKNVLIEKYKSIKDIQSVNIQDDITILVGMNESGKTSILESIAKTNYFEEDEDFKFITIHDYPRKEKKDMDKSGINPNAITCIYSIDSELREKIESDIGADILINDSFQVTTKYDNTRDVKALELNIDKFISNQLNNDDNNYSSEFISELSTFNNQEDYKAFIETYLENKAKENEPKDNETKDNEPIIGILKDSLLALSEYYPSEKSNNGESFLSQYITMKYLLPNLPKFLYYDEYYSLPSRINIELLEKGLLKGEEFKTASALFELTDINTKEIINSNNFENFIAELEATEATISDELFSYWKTNKNLEIAFRIETISTNGPNNTKQFEHVLDIRVKHKGVSLPLKNRSKGFNWFFSFLVWFRKIQADKDTKYILLLDEPGLNLHASAQKDLLRFIEDLSENYQIIYTTHSPFMIPELSLNRIRTVLETDEGTVISDSIQEKDPNTLFPLQAALGYDIAQNLFISEKNLLVEGVSDMIYLQIISSLLESEGRQHLRNDITIVPTGGLDKVASFISLMRGNDLDLVCLLDTPNDAKGQARLDDMVKGKLIHNKKIRFFHEFIKDYTHADIEDLFDKEDYLKIYNYAFSEEKEIAFNDLNSEIRPIIIQINQFTSKDRFNHYLPAKGLTTFLSNKKLSETTLLNFENVFQEVNKLFKTD